MHFSTLGVCLHTRDVAGLARFYVDLLGFTTALDIDWFVALRHPDRPEVDLCVIHEDHAALPEVAGPVRGVVLAFLVDDIDAEHARLVAAGARFAFAPRDEPWGQRRAVVLDPGGTGVELVQSIA